jgi:hypothetical protein
VTSGQLSGPTQFTWTPGAGATAFRLLVGDDYHGSSDIYDSGQLPLSTTAETVTIPSNGVNLYVRIEYLVSGSWRLVDYNFTEAGP